jgi:hypothetical protein
LGLAEVPPSPKDQTQELGELVEVSRNWTERGGDPEVILVTNETTGTEAALVTVTYPWKVAVLLPAEFAAMSVTV